MSEGIYKTLIALQYLAEVRAQGPLLRIPGAKQQSRVRVAEK